MEEGKADHHNHHDPDHFQVVCWEAEAVFREGHMFPLGSFPPEGHNCLSKNENGVKYLIK